MVSQFKGDSDNFEVNGLQKIHGKDRIRLGPKNG